MSAIATFTRGQHGRWRIVRNDVVTGEPLDPAERLDVVEGLGGSTGDPAWLLRGIPSYERYVDRRERTRLEASSPPLERPEAARLATVDLDGAPHLVPVTFVLEDGVVWFAVDHKQKRARPSRREPHW